MEAFRRIEVESGFAKKKKSAKIKEQIAKEKKMVQKFKVSFNLIFAI